MLLLLQIPPLPLPPPPQPPPPSSQAPLLDHAAEAFGALRRGRARLEEHYARACKIPAAGPGPDGHYGRAKDIGLPYPLRNLAPDGVSHRPAFLTESVQVFLPC